MRKRKGSVKKKLQGCPPLDALVWDCRVLEYGDELDGWRIEKFLAKGGFGAVYLAAADDLPERKAAVKIFADDVKDDINKGIARIRCEADIMRAVGDTYAPALYKVGDKGGRPYIIMEYMEAIDPEKDELPEREDEVREFVLELVDAVRALHEKGWIHCDLKPSNIARRRQDGRLVLLDFGSAHKIETDEEHVPQVNTMNTRDGEYVRVETRGYAPPELCFRPCRDIYAIGHIIRDCFKQDVPLEWSLVINKCIANNRKYRYANLDSLYKDVENIDRLGRDEMQRCIYEDRCRFMNLQAAISAETPTIYSWIRLKDLLSKKQEGNAAIYAGAGQLFIDFEVLAPARSISIVRPVTLSDERYVVVKGPGVIRMELDALLAEEDDDEVDVGIIGEDDAEIDKPVLVFLMNNATLINTTKKKLEEQLRKGPCPFDAVGGPAGVAADACWVLYQLGWIK